MIESIFHLRDLFTSYRVYKAFAESRSRKDSDDFIQSITSRHGIFLLWASCNSFLESIQLPIIHYLVLAIKTS